MIDQIERLALTEESSLFAKLHLLHELFEEHVRMEEKTRGIFTRAQESPMDRSGRGSMGAAAGGKCGRLLSRTQHLMCRAQAGLQCCVHGTPMPFRIGVFTRKKEGIFDRSRHSMRRIECPRGHVAVRAARELIGLPVVSVAAQ